MKSLEKLRSTRQQLVSKSVVVIAHAVDFVDYRWLYRTLYCMHHWQRVSMSIFRSLHRWHRAHEERVFSHHFPISPFRHCPRSLPYFIDFSYIFMPCLSQWHLATVSRTSTSEMQQQEKERLFSTSKCISGPLKNMICLFESDEKHCHIPVATGAWELGGPFLWSNSNFFQSCKLQSCGSWADVWRLVKIRGFSAISLCFFSGFALLWL